LSYNASANVFLLFSLFFGGFFIKTACIYSKVFSFSGSPKTYF